MHGAILPLLNTPSWRVAQLKNRTGTTLPLPFTFAYQYKLMLHPLHMFCSNQVYVIRRS